MTTTRCSILKAASAMATAPLVQFIGNTTPDTVAYRDTWSIPPGRLRIETLSENAATFTLLPYPSRCG